MNLYNYREAGQDFEHYAKITAAEYRHSHDHLRIPYKKMNYPVVELRGIKIPKTSYPCLRHLLLVKLVPAGSKQGTGIQTSSLRKQGAIMNWIPVFTGNPGFPI
jgi:hypothetical protein